MKSRTSLSVVLLLGLATLFILGCQFTTQVAPTPTLAPPTSTFTPASTPTEAASPTATPPPDISAAVLTLEDLPAGFEEFTLDELGMSLDDFEGEEFEPENVFVFINTQNFQMIFGFNFLLTERLDRASFDLGVSQPEITLPAFVGGMGSENVRDEKLLEDFEDVGDQRIGMTMVTSLEGLSTQVDVLMFRRDTIGAMVMSMTLEGQSPNITIHDLGLKLDQNMQENLQDLK